MINWIITSPLLIRSYAQLKLRAWEDSKKRPIYFQKKIFNKLIKAAEKTVFGKEHNFNKIKNHNDYIANVPLREYEGFIPFTDRILAGERNVLYPGRPQFFAKTSGTIAAIKYLPVTHTFAKTYSQGGLLVLFKYMKETGQYGLLRKKLMIIQGSPALADNHGIPTGRMSGISWYLMPKIMKGNRLPSFETNCIMDLGEKIEKIIDETIDADFSILGGMPPWVLWYFDKLLDRTGKKNISELFPNLKLYAHGGVNYEPYQEIVRQKIGGQVDTRDTYTASEGFFGFQEHADDLSMTLCTDNGVFYEFIPIEEVDIPNPTRLPLEKVLIGKQYAIALSTTAGLWAYLIGDTIMFTSINPFRFRVTGRVKQFTSLFGERVIEEEVRTALKNTLKKIPAKVKYFTVAPSLKSRQGNSKHEWWVEFEKQPDNLKNFEAEINHWMKKQNYGYRDRVNAEIMSPLEIILVRKNGFIDGLSKTNKIDGQNKIPVLSNNRELVNCLNEFCI